MTRVVLDTGVYLAFILPGPYSDAADQLFAILATGETALFAPDQIIAEFGSYLAEQLKLQTLSGPEIEKILKLFKECPLQLDSSLVLSSSALKIVRQVGVTFNQALFIAAALHHDTKLITTDAALVSNLSLSQYAEHCQLLQF